MLLLLLLFSPSVFSFYLAPLLVADRADLAAAADADGLLLPPGGVGVVLARRMLPEATALVGSVCPDAAAVGKAAADGANLVVLDPAGSAAQVGAARAAQRAAPIVLLPRVSTPREVERLAVVPGGLEGACLSLADLRRGA